MIWWVSSKSRRCSKSRRSRCPWWRAGFLVLRQKILKRFQVPRQSLHIRWPGLHCSWCRWGWRICPKGHPHHHSKCPAGPPSHRTQSVAQISQIGTGLAPVMSLSGNLGNCLYRQEALTELCGQVCRPTTSSFRLWLWLWPAGSVYTASQCPAAVRLTVFWILIIYQIRALQKFSSIVLVGSLLCDHFFCYTEASYFDIISFVWFWVLGVCTPNIIACTILFLNFVIPYILIFKRETEFYILVPFPNPSVARDGPSQN